MVGFLAMGQGGLAMDQGGPAMDQGFPAMDRGGLAMAQECIMDQGGPAMGCLAMDQDIILAMALDIILAMAQDITPAMDQDIILAMDQDIMVQDGLQDMAQGGLAMDQVMDTAVAGLAHHLPRHPLPPPPEVGPTGPSSAPDGLPPLLIHWYHLTKEVASDEFNPFVET